MKTKTKKFPVPQEVGPTGQDVLALESHEQIATAEDATDAPVLASTTIDLARLGLNQVAYVRRAVVDDMPVWSIYSATGHPLGAAPTLEQAWGAIMQNDLQPMFVN